MPVDAETVAETLHLEARSVFPRAVERDDLVLPAGKQEDPAVGGKDELGRGVELPGPLALLPDLPEEPAVRGKDLDVDVSPVQDVEVALRVDLEVLRPVEDGFGAPALPADGQVVLKSVADDAFFRERGIEDGPNAFDGLDLDGVGGGRGRFPGLDAGRHSDGSQQGREEGGGSFHIKPHSAERFRATIGVYSDHGPNRCP